MGAFCKWQIKGHSDEPEKWHGGVQVEADAIKAARQIDERLKQAR